MLCIRKIDIMCSHRDRVDLGEPQMHEYLINGTSKIYFLINR